MANRRNSPDEREIPRVGKTEIAFATERDAAPRKQLEQAGQSVLSQSCALGAARPNASQSPDLFDAVCCSRRKHDQIATRKIHQDFSGRESRECRGQTQEQIAAMSVEELVSAFLRCSECGNSIAGWTRPSVFCNSVPTLEDWFCGSPAMRALHHILSYRDIAAPVMACCSG